MTKATAKAKTSKKKVKRSNPFKGKARPVYPDEARRLAWMLYKEGRSHVDIVRVLKQQWPSFSEELLKKWITKNGWVERRAAYDKVELLTENKAEQVMIDMLQDLESVRTVLSDQIKKQAKKGEVNSQTAMAYAKVVDKMDSLLQRHKSRFDYLGNWTKFFSDLVSFLMGKDEKLARELDGHLDGFKEFVLENYGA